jgi:hypothetical protein
MDRTRARRRAFLMLAVVAFGSPLVRARDEPPALNPFGPDAPAVGRRDDARPGVVELSDGSKIAGAVYLTRDARLEIFDSDQKRKRPVPLSAVARIDAVVLREWTEREWRFAENASDAKVYTGRSYPAREVAYTLTLNDGRTIRGPLAALVYVRPEGAEPRRLILHQRDKGPVGTNLKSLVYVRSIRLGAATEAPPEPPARRKPQA